MLRIEERPMRRAETMPRYQVRKMPKQPYMAFYVGDFLNDTGLCSLPTRGFWMDLLCNLHIRDCGGQITATLEQFSRVCRCTVVDAHTALLELQTTRVAEVTERDGSFTITCRRMKKAADRQQINRVNGSKRAAKYQGQVEYDSEVEGELKVIEFCREIGVPESDGSACFHKWIGNGWTNGGKPIRDWKATIRSWRAAGYLPSQKQGSNGHHSKPKDDPHSSYKSV